jgi:hypothetical protein
MGNLPYLLLNATPLVSRFFAEMSKKRQRCAVVNLENNFSISTKFTDVYCLKVIKWVLPLKIKHSLLSIINVISSVLSYTVKIL